MASTRAITDTIATLPLRINPQRIGYLKFILEGYDGMALVTTVNAKEGQIIIRYPTSFHHDLAAIIADVAPQIFRANVH